MLQSTGLQRVRHDLATEQQQYETQSHVKRSFDTNSISLGKYFSVWISVVSIFHDFFLSFKMKYVFYSAVENKQSDNL